MISLGLSEDLKDVRGDGNCLYYCMLDYLMDIKELPWLWNQIDNPLIFMRRLLNKAGQNLNESYWTFLSSASEPRERLDCIYDERINYYDEDFMLKC